MSILPADLFKNPVWHSLQKTHQRFAISTGNACRYKAEVAPFGALVSTDESAIIELAAMMEPGEDIILAGKNLPLGSTFVHKEAIDCFQMVFPAGAEVPEPTSTIIPLSPENAEEMLALTTVAFPEYYRKRTCEMGRFYGIRTASSELVAIGGERMRFDHYPEISSVCTHPAHRGKGYAASLLYHILKSHQRERLTPWLHVAQENHGAIEFYKKLGFATIRETPYCRIRRA